MILETGNVLVVVHRRLYEKDRARFFIGRVQAYQLGVARVHGNSWAQDQFNGTYIKKKDERSKIISLQSGSVLTYVLPSGVKVEQLRFENDERGRLWLRDGEGWKMDMTENEHTSG